ncbi:MAG TPA: sigma-70 family RNA polymerase sigma factor [Thermoanaerobaculia bacterium]|nr:sigma-70 family RNA polymerase sigma factor [Thermoanaerobaculia bacterium]
MTPEAIYLENLPTIERIASFVAHRNHLNPDEATEFVQETCVRLIDQDYAILRKFEGRSKLSTYLHIVIERLFKQWRVQLWGKWRPSAEAKRLGDKAVTLEKLLTRDGYTFAEAVKELTTPGTSQFTAAELEAIYVRLPLRSPRPVFVPDDAAPDVSAVDSKADDRVEMHERERVARKVAAAADRLLESMNAEDRLMLRLRYWQGATAPEIAQRLRIEPKKIYKRLERLAVIMRDALEKAGITKEDVDPLLCHGDQEIRFGFPYGEREISPTGPSHDSGGETGGSEREDCDEHSHDDDKLPN